ncbi:SH3 and cysteine-rich domain-containing protein isoform X2 [Anticarsia gemmatalis]|uniref:SH3 and cysteine-rich domain-containing protein isoform X2 n=1 Tax=Anticarsia gemmatalis TaxID=129554 RepID=UPI003F75B563
MYVIYPADEVVSLTYSSYSLPRQRPRPTLDIIFGPPPSAPSRAHSPPRNPTLTSDQTHLKTAPPESPERAPASPTPSLERPKLRERTKAKLLKKLGRHEDNEFGKIVRTPAPDEFELPAPLPTPAFSRKNIFDRNFDALFEVANLPQFGAHIRVTTPEPDRRPDVSAAHFPSATESSLSLLPPRPHSEPSSTPPTSARTSTPSTPTPLRSSLEGPAPNSKAKKVSFFRKLSRAKEASPHRSGAMQQQPSVEMALRELNHPTHNDQLKNQQQVTFKLVKTVADFTTQLSQLYERHSSELQVLVASFRKRNSEIRKERASCPSSLFHTWETLLQEVEADVVGYNNAAQSLERLVSTPLIDRTFHMKVQARKLFAHREGCEVILGKADDQLNKSRQEYRGAFLNYCNNPTPATLATYYDSHNSYVQQLTATNAMLDQYHKHTLPTILQELEEILTDVTSAVSEAICQEGEIITDKSNTQLRRYESLCAQARAVSSTADLAHLARTLLTAQPPMRPPKRAFMPPYPPEPDDPPLDVAAESMPPILRGEILLDRMGAQARVNYDQLRKDAQDLEIQIKQLQDSLDALARHQTRGIESNLYNKVNEIQEDISIKKYDYRATQLHLAAVRAQRELFAAKADSGAAAVDRKLSSSSAGSMKNKWLKAFRSLKPPSAPPPHAAPPDKRNGAARDAMRAGGDSEAHNFQEYTYKKITPCDVCSQVLRGHTRQGLRCRLCKMNVHTDCMPQVGKCVTKSRLLRRQKSTSEIESHRVQETAFDDEKEEVDQTYQVLKRANEIAKPGGDSRGGPVVRVSAPEEPPPARSPARPTAGLAVAPQPVSSSSGSMKNSKSAQMLRQADRTSPLPAPHSPRRQKLNLRMKSLSLDSPECGELRRRPARDQQPSQGSRVLCNCRAVCMRHGFNRINNYTIHNYTRSSPSSPVHSRRLLSARGGRMSSVELPDEPDKSLSSNSASPCPSPVKQPSKHQRLLPTNLYVILYNFKSRHADELDLKAGYKVTVIDTSDPDWWKGKCLGKIGYFPSKYCTKLQAGERPLQVTHNLQVSDGDNGLMLLRDQIVIQVGDEVDGMVMIRSGDNRQGVCPVKFLQEV